MIDRVPTTFSIETFCEPRQLDVKGVAFIFSMVVALNPIIAEYHVPQYLIWGIDIIWAGIAFITLLRNSVSGISSGDGAFRSISKLFMYPKLAVWTYGIALFVFGIAPVQYASTGFTQLLSIFLPLSALYLFGAKTVDYIFWAALISFIPQVYFTCAADGLDSPMNWLYSFIDDSVSNPFENHEITFTAAFLFTYYVGIDRYKKEKDVLKIAACIFMLLLGFKRILVLSIGAAFGLIWICNRISQKSADTLLRLASACLLIGCWVFLVAIYNGIFFDITEALGVNMMGRNYYYAQIASVTEFSPSFLGLGLNAVSNMLTTTYSYMRVGGVHSDILKYYAEIGFIGFALWSWFYLLKLPKMIELRFGPGSAYAMRIINVLAFVTYFTDNIDIYLGSQLLYVAIPIVFAMRRRYVDSCASAAAMHELDKNSPSCAPARRRFRQDLHSSYMPLERG